MGLREQKKHETRDRLVGSALELFGTIGYNTTTVEDIAASAGVSTRTFFHYFATKQDVLLGFEDELLARLVADVRAHSGGSSPVDVMWDALEALARFFDDDSERMRPLYAQVLEIPAVHRRSLELQIEWHAQFADALALHMAGRGRVDRAQVLAAVGLACFRTAAARWAQATDASSVSRSLQLARRTLRQELAA